MKNVDNYSLWDVSIEKLKKELHVKRIRGKDYFYIAYKVSVIIGRKRSSKYFTFYVCPTRCNDIELRYCYCLAQRKFFLEAFEFFYKQERSFYSPRFFNKETLRLLDFLRFGYMVLLERFGTSDLKRYEDAVFTKYVYGTTSIEGNTYTLRETDITLNEGLTIGGKERREFYEIINYSKLKEFVESRKNIKIDIKFIKKIHSIIMENIDSDSAGRFRRIDVGIRGSEFEPVPGIFVEEEMNKLIKWYEKNEDKMHPIELTALFHQKFEEIHPFRDGNGRVGRELMRLILSEGGYPTIFIDMKNREKYLKSLDEGNKGNHKILCNFIAENLLDVHKGLVERSQTILNIKQEDFEEFCKKCIHKQECQKQTLKQFK